ncbi:uncharacterized protein M6B38_402930 [Iris pallida]|uniref:Uncharacterized protein n=1 Tax=Iris pallida TaxID=29817 RepID=A0AAX6FTI2_IRIPA|nr:uncharacterized protein M6B38_402930 [Iris pallida]
MRCAIHSSAMEATMAAAAAASARPFTSAATLSSPHSFSRKCALPAAKLFSTKTSTTTSTSISSSSGSGPTDEPPNRELQHPGLVFDAGPANSWDSRAVGSPVVNRYVGDDRERWFMWYHAARSIGLAVSNNGVHWERAGPVMEPSTDWWAFDTHSVAPSEVLVMSSDKLRPPGGAAVYWLYYTGSAAAPGEDASAARPPSLPGLALSQDGRHWARIEGEHHTGALFDAGGPGRWDSLSAAAPKVVYHSPGDLRMYYHSWDPAGRSSAIGIARSRDGIKWAKLGRVLAAGPAGCFDEAGVRNGHVVRMRNGRGYLMAYEGVSAEGATSIGLAVSSDGLKGWTRCGDVAVLKPSPEEEDGWDSGGVDAPCLVQMDGDGDGGDEWRLYYRGTGGDGRTGIGMAVSLAGNQHISFERWSGFRL